MEGAWINLFIICVMAVTIECSTTTYISMGRHLIDDRDEWFEKLDYKNVEQTVEFMAGTYNFTKALVACANPAKYCQTSVPNAVTCTIATEHSWTCKCNFGFSSTASDGLGCADNDECALRTHTCNVTQTCINNIGGYNCQCIGHSTIVQGQCDLNECSQTPGICGSYATCRNTLGGFECDCHEDYLKTTGNTCSKALCSATDNPCGSHSDCTDIVTGSILSFNCTCHEGYYSATGGNCQDVNECLDASSYKCTTNSGCVNTDGSYTCKCNKHYLQQNTTCVYDPCLSRPCGQHAICHQYQAANMTWLRNCTCETGFRNNNGVCEDINECVATGPSAAKCTANSDCINTYGSFFCKCGKNYIKTADMNCALDPCADNNECGTNSDCIRRPLDDASFVAVCRCKNGFQSPDQKNCIDINECILGKKVCPSMSSCENTVGSFRCKCTNGYAKNSQNICVPKKCTQESCGTNAECVDTDASGGEMTFQCKCKKGYSPINQTHCIDMDECNTIANVCPDHSTCVNKVGSYQCPCYLHYLPENNVCVKDPCWDGTPCGTFSKCTSILTLVGGREKWVATCRCHDGFRSDFVNQTNCTDANECSVYTKPACVGVSECINLAGTFLWRCNDTYVTGITTTTTTTAAPTTLATVGYKKKRNDANPGELNAASLTNTSTAAATTKVPLFTATNLALGGTNTTTSASVFLSPVVSLEIVTTLITILIFKLF